MKLSSFAIGSAFLILIFSLGGCGGTASTNDSIKRPVYTEISTLNQSTAPPAQTHTPTPSKTPVTSVPAQAATPSASQTTITPASSNKRFTVLQKVNNRPTIPVFAPWAGSTGCSLAADAVFQFQCDSAETPYSLIWTGVGIPVDIEQTQPEVSPEQTGLMRGDKDTLYIVSEDWLYWNAQWRYLDSASPYYTNKHFAFSAGEPVKYIKFFHSNWPNVLATKALNYKKAGFDGMILDWWHNESVDVTLFESDPSFIDIDMHRLAIARAIRARTGDDFLLMGNVNWKTDDPTAQYLSGAFFELWKYNPRQPYVHTIDEENQSWSLERMEKILRYWDTNLREPKVLAFEPFKTDVTSDYQQDHFAPENIQRAKLITAMVMVIPKNGYILYADGYGNARREHGHPYYDFYHTDFGKPVSREINIRYGVGYRRYERGFIAYNRTTSPETISVDGNSYTLQGSEGLFVSK